jgi:hypothetical protein
VQGLRLGLGGQSSGTANPYNTAFGYYALSKTSSSSSIANNVAIGYQSLKKTTTGTDNVSVGANSLMNNTTGSNNIGIGSGALAFNADSSNNTAMGYNALYNNTSGYWNLAIGTNSLYSTQTSSNNIAIGYKALYWTTIGANLAVGNNALYSNSSGYYNLGIGSGALFCNTTGLQNAGIGLGSLYNNETGSNNVAFGMNALYNNEIGSNNVAIGYNAGPTGTNKASLSNSIAIGYNATTTASNTIKMGNSDIIQMNTSGTIGVGNYSSDSAASGITGSIYYNTTDDVLKVYDGSTWSSIGSGNGYTGPTGPIGYTGYTGHMGYTGYTGYTGADGVSYTGPTGYTGPQGPSLAGVTEVYTDGFAKGAQITAENYLQLGEATENYPGLVTTGSQIFAGAKSFVLDVSVNHLIVGAGGSKYQIVTVGDSPYYLSSSDYGKLIRVTKSDGYVYLPTASTSPYGSTITIYADNNFYYVKIYSSGGSIYLGIQTFNSFFIESDNIITFVSDGSDLIITTYNYPSKTVGAGTTHDMYSPCNLLVTNITIENIYLPKTAPTGAQVVIRKTYSDAIAIKIRNDYGDIYNKSNVKSSGSPYLHTMDTDTYTITLIADDSNNWYVE